MLDSLIVLENLSVSLPGCVNHPWRGLRPSTGCRKFVPGYMPADFTSRIKRDASLRSSCSTV